MFSLSRQRRHLTSVAVTSQTVVSPIPAKSRSDALLSYDEIPEWLQDNDCIRDGYRPESSSVRACFASWFYVHNETINIFTHLLPAVSFLLVGALFDRWIQSTYPEATTCDRLIFAFFLLTAATCLGFSAIYHTLMNHSMRVSELWLRIDFVGIIILTLGDFVSGIYMVFYCESTLQKVYWTMVRLLALCCAHTLKPHEILTLGVASIYILVNPKFQGRRFRTFRVGTFVVTGLSGLAPLAHGMKLFGFSQMMKQSGMPYYLAEGLVLLLGALFYTTRIPESFKPGGFDIFGCSHQIFHVLVVLATGMQLIGILAAFDYNYHHRICKVTQI